MLDVLEYSSISLAAPVVGSLSSAPAGGFNSESFRYNTIAKAETHKGEMGFVQDPLLLEFTKPSLLLVKGCH